MIVKLNVQTNVKNKQTHIILINTLYVRLLDTGAAPVRRLYAFSNSCERLRHAGSILMFTVSERYYY